MFFPAAIAMRHVFAALVLAALATLPASAQRALTSELISAEGPFTLCTLEVPDTDNVYHGVNQLRESAAAKSGGSGATITVTYSGFSGPAQIAFEYAADIWEAHLESDVTIRVEAIYEPLGTNVLGSAGALRVYADPSFPIPNTFYGDALADALAGRDLSPGNPDIRARFSSNFTGWYFGTDGNTPIGQVDFVSVVLHELGHGLGFFGSATVQNGVGQYGIAIQGGDLIPVVFDRFVEDSAGNRIVGPTYPNPSGALGNLLRSQNLFWGGATAIAVYGGERPPIYAPAAWEQGSSFSHYDETVIPTGNVNALMTPQLARGESFQNPGPLTCALFQDIGWTLAPGCARLVVDDEDGPESGPFALEPAGPHPFREATALRLRIPEPQAVRATLLDALGREVSVLYDGTASTGALTLRVAGDLAPGVYTVLVEAEAGRATTSLVHVR